jgi:hypothetical protein
LLSDSGNDANAEVLSGMWNDNKTWARGMPENVMRAADPIKDPPGGFQLTDDRRTLHCPHHTHDTSQVLTKPAHRLS